MLIKMMMLKKIDCEMKLINMYPYRDVKTETPDHGNPSSGIWNGQRI